MSVQEAMLAAGGLARAARRLRIRQFWIPAGQIKG